jgi:cytochrome P450
MMARVRSPLLGSLPESRRDPLGFLLSVSSGGRDVIPIRLAHLRVFLLNRPEHVEDVLVTHQHRFVKGKALARARRLFGNGLLTSDGETHIQHRRLIQPALHRNRLGAYGASMAALAASHRDRWRSGDLIDIASEMDQLTLTIVGRTMFGADLESIAEQLRHAMTTALDLLEVPLLPLAPFLDVLPLPRVRRFRSAKLRLDATLYELIESRRRAGADTGDLLSALLAAGMNDREARDEAITILLGGHETVANALSWTWYLIAEHPAVEARLHEEIDSVLGDRRPSAEDVASLPFARMVFAEAMRLYPPAWLIGRAAVEKHPAGECVIPAGSLVVLSPWVVHRDPRFFPDPEQFDPDRWRPEQADPRPKFSYFPFGGGLRGCMGEAFAWMEGVLVIAILAQRWRFRLVGEAPRPHPALTLKPQGGVRVRVDARQKGG